MEIRGDIKIADENEAYSVECEIKETYNSLL